MKIIYFLTFIFTTYSYGNEPIGDLIKKLSSLEEVTCEEMTSEDLAQHCAREVCGAPGSKNSKVSVNNLHKFISPQQQEELKAIDREVGKIVNQEKQKIQDLAQELEKRKSDTNFLNTKDWDKYDYLTASNLMWKYIIWEVDSTRPFKERSFLTIKDTAPNYLIPAIEEVFNNFNAALYDNPIRAYDSGVLTLEEFKSAVMQKAQRLQNELAEQKRKTSFDLDKFNSNLSRLSSAEQIKIHFNDIKELGDEYDIKLEPDIFHCQEKCQKTFDEFLSKLDLDTVIANLEIGIEYTDEKDKIAECKASYISTNQKNNLSQNFEQIWPQVKEGYLKNVVPRFSSHSQNIIKDYLENGVHFYFENPTNKRFPDLKQKSQQDKNIISNKDKSHSYLLEGLINNYYDSDINLFHADIQVCDRYAYPSLIWDSYLAKEYLDPSYAAQYPHYNPHKDNIAVSPFSCEHQQEGAGIVAHELGHAISHLMTRDGMSSSSLASYREIRDCASQQWDMKEPSSRTYHPGDSQFTEEDSADILSYIAVNDGTSLYACGLLATDSNETTYTDLDTQPWGDHSPSLIRLLREITYKKDTVPKTCQTLMSRHQDKLGDKKCF